MKKTKLGFKKSIYIGFNILNLSKHLRFHYNAKEKNYGVKIKLCYQDTNSLKIKTKNIYKDMSTTLFYNKVVSSNIPAGRYCTIYWSKEI